MKNFDHFTKDYKIINTTLDYDNAFISFTRNKYDIMSFIGTLIVYPGDTPLMLRDYISCIDYPGDLYMVVDNNEKKINYNDKILNFLSSLNPILIRNKTDKSIIVTLKRFFVRQDIIDRLIYCTIYEGDYYYQYGEIHLNI